MRHRVYGKHLGRNKDARDNLFRGLVQELFLHGTIQTSTTKAKAIKGLVDKIINLAKEKKVSQLQNFVTNKLLRERLIKEITPRLGTRISGFTSTVRLGTRAGDRTEMVRMSLIGAEKLEPIKKEQQKAVSKEEKVSRAKRVPQVSRGVKPRGTRDTSKARGTIAKRKVTKK